MPEIIVNNFQNDILDKKNQYEISHRKTKSAGLGINNIRGRAQSNTSKKDSVDFSHYQIVDSSEPNYKTNQTFDSSNNEKFRIKSVEHRKRFDINTIVDAPQHTNYITIKHIEKNLLKSANRRALSASRKPSNRGISKRPNSCQKTTYSIDPKKLLGNPENDNNIINRSLIQSLANSFTRDK